MAPLVGLIVFMGVYPKPIFDRIEPAVVQLVQHVEDNSDYREPGVAREGEEVVPESERQGTDEGGHDEAAATGTSEGGH